MNIPTISRIEYISRSSVGIPVGIGDEVSSTYFYTTFTELDLGATTGSLTDEIQRDGSGNSFHYTKLQFFMPELSAEQKNELNDISSKPVVYRITDGSGKRYILGSDIYRANMVFGEDISATPDGRNGYNCTVTCKSRYGLLIYKDATGS